MNIFDVIIRPVITEKATGLEKDGKYQLLVRRQATKIDVKEAFKKLYGVEVLKVNSMHTAGKTRIGRSRKPVTKKHEFKKVIVTTKAKKTIDLIKPKLKI